MYYLVIYNFDYKCILYMIYSYYISLYSIVIVLLEMFILFYFTHKTLEQVENKISNDGNGEIGPFRRHLDMMIFRLVPNFFAL